ncbi:P-loop ATPase, Sll1717 family [Mesorhizobium sp. ANAO-SY3R2]|uniref:P-loop ATPase, Sll1717 family n=1 Tax=Mesorhizobium sp. ANAO-SY3R2 TaxID=3166644 RepID=UPI00366C9EEC
MATSTKLLPLRQLRFGNVDARYEVTSRNPKEVEHFRRSFVEPAGMNTEEFIEGHRFFVHGVKGAGKTSFLRFVQLKTSEQGSLTKFISFATEISDAERTKISSLSGIDVYEQGGVEITNNSAVDVWIVFILRHLARLIEDNRQSFTTHKSITVFCELMRKVYDGEDSKGLLKWLSDALKTGQYKFKSKHLDATLKGKAGEEEKLFPTSYVIEQSFRLLKDLGWEEISSIYIFFDEINLSFASKATHKRDIILIRDLIIAIDRINAYFIEEHKPIYVLAAARSEVLNALNAPTHEINKILADRGRELRWFAKNAGTDWPIIKLVDSKILASEALEGMKREPSAIDRYFHREIFGFAVRDFIIETTWCNPRDLVLLFGEAVANATYQETIIGSSVISRSLENYSASAWREKAEELSVEYAPQEIQGIKKILLNMSRHFKILSFEQSWKSKSDTDNTLVAMKSKYKAGKILDDLYRVGILGQSSKEPTDNAHSFTQHWAYRGDTTFDASAWFVVHKALWPELRLGKLKAQSNER